jgi:hypothetical protein
LRATCPAQLITLDSITRTPFGEQYKWSSSVRSCLLSRVPSTLLGSSTHPHPLNTLSLCSSINTRDLTTERCRIFLTRWRDVLFVSCVF